MSPLCNKKQTASDSLGSPSDSRQRHWRGFRRGASGARLGAVAFLEDGDGAAEQVLLGGGVASAVDPVQKPCKRRGFSFKFHIWFEVLREVLGWVLDGFE